MINIAPRGIASQSSMSKWSKKNDAQRAVMELKDDFSFHTGVDNEESGWWMLELDNNYLVKTIQIENRVNTKYQMVSSSVEVKVSSDGVIWRELYSGNSLFGALPSGNPLTLSFEKGEEFRFIKIVNLERKHLHFKAVRVFSESDRIEKKFFSFIANRRDGFGERLKTILKAIVAAKVSNCHFLFSWEDIGTKSRKNREFHSIVDKELVFSKDFIQRHFIVKEDLDNQQHTSLKSLSLPLGKGEEGKVCLIESRPIESINPHLKDLISWNAYEDAFKQIEFSSRYTYIMSLVDSQIQDKECIALHLRAGDIVYGIFRESDRFTGKVIPFSIIIDMLSNIDNSGKVYIFGQDHVQLEYLKKQFNVTLACELVVDYGLNHAETAFFEMYLMSKIPIIYAYPSAFSYVPTMIGQCEIISPSSLYNKVDILKIIESSLDSNLSAFSNLQRAHSITYILKNYYSHLSLQRRINYLERAKKLDESNLFFKLLHVAFLYENNQDKSADYLIEKLLVNDFLLLVVYLKGTDFYRSFLGKKAIRSLQQYIGSSAYVDVILFLIFFYAREKSDSKEYKLKLVEKGHKIKGSFNNISITLTNGVLLDS